MNKHEWKEHLFNLNESNRRINESNEYQYILTSSGKLSIKFLLNLLRTGMI